MTQTRIVLLSDRLTIEIGTTNCSKRVSTMAARTFPTWLHILSAALFVTLTSGFVNAQKEVLVELTLDGGRLAIAQGETQDIRTTDHMRDVVISNDDAIDVVVLDSRTLRIVSKGRGISNLIVTGEASQLVGQAVIEVLPPKNSTVTIHRGGTLSTYSCRWGLCDYSAAQVDQAFSYVGILRPAETITPRDRSNTAAPTGDADRASVTSSISPQGRDRQGACAAQQGNCIAQCNGEGRCIGNCAAILGVCMAGASEQATASGTSSSGLCIGNCGAQEGLCIAGCNGDGQCIGQCAAQLGQCTARCTQ